MFNCHHLSDVHYNGCRLMYFIPTWYTPLCQTLNLVYPLRVHLLVSLSAGDSDRFELHAKAMPPLIFSICFQNSLTIFCGTSNLIIYLKSQKEAVFCTDDSLFLFVKRYQLAQYEIYVQCICIHTVTMSWKMLCQYAI